MTDTPEKIALVTGASRGLGSACAETLARRGYHVIAVARTVGGLEELDDRIQTAGGSATLAPVDITNEDALRQICRGIYDRWGRIDLLVHAAIHAPPLAPLPHMSEKDLDKTLAVNVRATARLIANVAPLLQASPVGAALFFNDKSKSERFHGPYGLSKAAQMRMARSWQDETAKIGPVVHVLTPAPMPTALRARFYPGEDRSALADPKAEAERLLSEIL
ncbi:SDR family NAD(P)-dependent oxidoreductase [Litoreibacter roseus]|uniref:Oxidoreductase n=1 Tax=Litoreibacter roseus TaxID=2601869 RepID=A0A6N6JFE9_9RHOB|nr:SDR family oxidoreductase [Litoreibacter roseus]GFE63932.1 oxidoreductase [Litoreibacter roseus]